MKNTVGPILETGTELADEFSYYQAYRKAPRRVRESFPFHERPFLAFDGEGVTHPGHTVQSYVLLGASDGEKQWQIHGKSLSSKQCLTFLLMQERQHPHHIKVTFSFNYDVNMMIADLHPAQLRNLINSEWAIHGGIRIRWMRGKWLEVKSGGTYTKLYDIFTFFQCKFTTALEQYLESTPDLQKIIEGKEKRNVFEYHELETFIRPYMESELIHMVKLCNQLRDLLAELDVHPRGWHGPGAVSGALLSLHRVYEHRPATDLQAVEHAAAFAYFGGRFEDYKCGLYEGPVYQYDIRSAYPYALTLCPALTQEYEYHNDPNGEPPDFSLCRISYANEKQSRTDICPLPLRSDNGAIYYPSFMEGYVWGVEYKAAKRMDRHLQLKHWIEFQPSDIRPFEFVGELYRKRAQWKLEGNPVQLAAKLSMNSIYGKLAQRVGWNREKMTAPRNHQLRWAGFTTAVCRAKMLDLMAQAPDRIIAVETDGIYSEVPLQCDIGPELGQFEEKEHDGILYVQSGVYFTRKNGEWQKGKTRGFTPNKADINAALTNVKTLMPLVVSQNRFQGLPLALDNDKWRSWIEADRMIAWGGNGKRIHIPHNCSGCENGTDWHETSFALPKSPYSRAHKLPWRDYVLQV